MGKLTKKELGARTVLLIASIIWGTTFVAISKTGAYFPPAFLLLLRCGLAGIVLLLVFIKRISNLTKDYFIVGSMLGVLMTGGYLVQTISLTTAGCPPGRCGFLVATYCVITPFTAWIIEGKKPNIFNISAAVLCLAGILCISLPNMLLESSIAMNAGDIYALLSSLIFAVYLVYIGKYMQRFDPILITIIHLFFAALYSAAYSLLFEDITRIVWNGTSIAAVLYLSIICMAVTNVMQAVGQRDCPASTAALIFSLESVFGIIFAVVLLHESVSLMMLVGCVLIFISILISEGQLSILKMGLSRNLLKYFH